MTTKETTIYLSDSDVKRWQYFQQHYEKFVILIDNKAFDINYGKATLNFSESQLKTVVKEEIVYHKSVK